MKYEAFINDNEIAINFLKAIFKKKKERKLNISKSEFLKLKKEVVKLRAEGYKSNEIKEKLNINQHRLNSILYEVEV